MNINNKINLFYIVYVYSTPSILIVLELVVGGASFVYSSVVIFRYAFQICTGCEYLKVNYFQKLTFFDLKLVKNKIKI